MNVIQVPKLSVVFCMLKREIQKNKKCYDLILALKEIESWIFNAIFHFLLLKQP